jgi:predicted transcriptional regulator
LEEIATIMRHEDVGAVPIMDDNELVGLVTDRDIVLRCVAEGGDPAESIAEDILTDGLIAISPEDDLPKAADLMSRNQIRRLPVVSENRLIGMVSLGDIAVKQQEDRGDTVERVSRGVKRSTSSQRDRTSIVPTIADDAVRKSGRVSRRKIG